MSWNESGNKGSDQDPWQKPGQNSSQPERPNSQGEDKNPRQNSNNDQQPPDIEEIFSNLLKKLGGGNQGGNRNKNQPAMPSFGLNKLLPLALLAGVIIWGASGFYTIKEAERGVVTRLGKLHEIVLPGLNWKPTFIDQVRAVNVEQVGDLKTQGAMLTKDENMVKVEMNVLYRIKDPAQYLFNVVNPKDSLSQATDSALRYVIGHTNMDDILTKGRDMVREETRKTLNQIIEPYKMGLEVIDVNFQSALPPEEVKDAFDDAIKAQEDEQRYIREAEAYAREREPNARGDAKRIVEAATAYKEQVVLDAQGEVERFQRLLPEFKASPEITMERLYIQSMEKIMAQTPKIMLDGNANNLNVLPLEQLLNRKIEASAPVANGGNPSINSDKAPEKPATPAVEANNKATTNEKPESKPQGRFN